MANELDNKEQMAQAEEPIAAAKSKKDSFMEGFRSKHPDWAEDDEEGFYGALAEDNAAMDEEMNGYKSREDEMSKALGGSAMNAALFLDAANGKPVPLAILERFPEEVKAWMDDPANSDALKKTFEAHADKIEENKKLQAEADANLAETNAMIDEMIANGEIKDENELNELVDFLGNIATGLMVNHIEKEWLLAAKKAINHDADVAAAKTQGEIDGRNQKISAQRKESNKAVGNHTGLGASNAGRYLSRNETNNAVGSRKRDMWSGMKTTKLN